MMTLRPQIWANRNSSASTQAKQTSFHVFELFAFLAASTAPWNCLSFTNVTANLAQFEIKANGLDHLIQQYEHDTKVNPWKYPLYQQKIDTM